MSQAARYRAPPVREIWSATCPRSAATAAELAVAPVRRDLQGSHHSSTPVRSTAKAGCRPDATRSQNVERKSNARGRCRSTAECELASCGVRALTTAIALSATLGCPPGKPDRERSRDTRPTSAAESVATAAPPPWYRQARALDLTADGRLDSVRLDAVGVRPDSLRITLLLIVDGAVKHREQWASSYELALMDTSRRSRPQVAALLRGRLDSVLSSVRVERLDAPGVRLMPEDRAILSGLEPAPTHRISFAYGYETTVRLVWDAPRQHFVRLWSCC